MGNKQEGSFVLVWDAHRRVSEYYDGSRSFVSCFWISQNTIMRICIKRESDSSFFPFTDFTAWSPPFIFVAFVDIETPSSLSRIIVASSEAMGQGKRTFSKGFISQVADHSSIFRHLAEKIQPLRLLFWNLSERSTIFVNEERIRTSIRSNDRRSLEKNISKIFPIGQFFSRRLIWIYSTLHRVIAEICSTAFSNVHFDNFEKFAENTRRSCDSAMHYSNKYVIVKLRDKISHIGIQLSQKNPYSTTCIGWSG